MKLCLDSSVALKTVLPEIDSANARRLIAEVRQGIHDLLAPDVFPVELGHALTRAERQRRIAPPDGWQFRNAIMAHGPDLHPSLPLMQRAFHLSSTFRVGLYDCLYISLDEREQCKVVTADQRLVNMFPALTVPLSSL